MKIQAQEANFWSRYFLDSGFRTQYQWRYFAYAHVTMSILYTDSFSYVDSVFVHFPVVIYLAVKI